MGTNNNKFTKFTKNRQKEAFLKSLESGASITESCNAANLSRMTIWNWRKKSKTFDNQISIIIDSRTQSVEDALYSNAIKGNVTAQIFWLKNRAKERWSDRFEHLEEIKGELEVNIDLDKKLAQLDIQDLIKLSQLNQKTNAIKE